ncbi:ATP-binding cassette domain-containing protein [Pyrofollis japonicus]|uniref:ATP-binding cassette domain-containing protein n=1 Tax=Pyrofollis japonicus TaxID=3060460 RepID=UPI00295BC9BC|nr:ATP-binding cassette domain-containing protein [Pyrofollis japonicus]BEP17939.1 ATP-binding cassette domain-containing protein [Pyrofollis japonicus]
MSSNDYVIIVENLVKKYGDFPAVRGISFRVRRGEIFGFLGPNGAGKTTTIHVLATLLRPTSGKAIVAGYDVMREPDKVRKSIGIVFQDPSLDDSLTAYENMYIHGRVYGLRGRLLEERIEELLRFVELYEHRNRLVKTFSGGMRRRLEIARALLHEPIVLFLDEPTLGLDPQTRTHIWDYIRRLRNEKNVTVFMTTHYMEEAEQLCDRIAIIDHGKIIAEGTPEQLKSLVGSDIIYLKIAGPIDDACSFFASIDGVEECKKLGGDRVALKARDAPKMLPRILVEASRRGIEVLEASYHRPTLNDVFIYLTGREIREEEIDSAERIRLYARSIMMRRG